LAGDSDDEGSQLLAALEAAPAGTADTPAAAATAGAAAGEEGELPSEEGEAMQIDGGDGAHCHTATFFIISCTCLGLPRWPANSSRFSGSFKLVHQTHTCTTPKNNALTQAKPALRQQAALLLLLLRTQLTVLRQQQPLCEPVWAWASLM
jgi:hypothetical protein